ncbi:alpha/beta hydrolase [Leptospira sp. WS92.C1]
MKRSVNMFFSLLFVFLFAAPLLVWWNQDKLIFFPEKLPEDFPFSFSSEFQEIAITTPDGNQSYALYFKAAKNPQNKIILFFHGNAGSLRSWGSISENFLPLGWDILITDYRGYGKNTGSLSEKTMYSDAELWLEYLQTNLNRSKDQIVIYGRSIGTGVAVDLTSKHPELHLFLETPFTDLPSLAKIYYPFLQPWMLRFQFQNLKKLENIRSKIRIFHGTEDEIIPFSNSETIFKKLQENKQSAVLFVIKNGTHNDLTLFPEYHQALKKSLDEIR